MELQQQHQNQNQNNNNNHQAFYNLFEPRQRPLIIKSKTPAVKWFKQWVPQDVVATGGKCFVMKWVTEAQMKAIKEKMETPVAVVEPEPEPTTEVLFLCSYDGCGKTFIDAGALRKHSHIHGERQYVCHYENCGKKFLDSSKLKRHHLIHTGERDYICSYEGCGKAFSLDFNLRSHMKTHSQENYHICPFQECGKRYAHEYKLKNHIMSHHEKQNPNNLVELPPKYVQVQPVEKPPPKPPKAVASTPTYAVASSHRPYACPYEGCGKAYIHEYKLNLHLRREHPGHLPEDNSKNTARNKNNDADMDAGSDHDGYAVKRGNTKSQKQSHQKPTIKLPPAKAVKRKPPPAAAKKQPWPVAGQPAHEEEDSEETEEDREDGWRYGDGDNNNDDDDEETEYED